MTEKHFEEIRTRYGKWASWAVWDEQDITDTACIEEHIGSLRPGVIFIGLNASRDISQKDWLNFHTNHKADRNLRSLLNAAPWKGSYITDIFKGKNRITGNS
ncbi:MAG: hypothetical protein LBQ67_05005, partial [Treponema sp.]|nr:hypothetical protein [Treponema sp.]